MGGFITASWAGGESDVLPPPGVTSAQMINTSTAITRMGQNG